MTDISDSQMGEGTTQGDLDKFETPKAAGRKIAMLGTAPSTRGLAPYDSDWEIWGQADYWRDLKRIDRWFEFAPMVKLQQEFPEYLKFLEEGGFPVYMRRQYENIPGSREFDFETMADTYGREFMSATLVWMMSQALTEHDQGQTIDCIGLWGYDMALDGEYNHQRPGIRHLEWIASQKGIAVYIPKGSDLSITPIPYPFAEDDPMVVKVRTRRNDIENRKANAEAVLAKHQQEVLNLQKSISFLDGAIEDLNYFERMVCGVKDPAA